MLAGVPVMVIWRSDEPSMALAILICAPDICRISFILVPWRPIMQPISWGEKQMSLQGTVSKHIDISISTISLIDYEMVWV